MEGTFGDIQASSNIARHSFRHFRNYWSKKHSQILSDTVKPTRGISVVTAVDEIVGGGGVLGSKHNRF